MEFSFEHPPPLRKYTLKIWHGGSITTGENSYQNYIKGEVILAKNLDPKEASLDLFKNIAIVLGYQDSKFWYRRSTDGKFSEITNTDLVREMISELSADRELKIFLVDGVRERRQVEQYPTIMFWNCRGLNDLKMDELRALNLIYDPNIVFLIETRLSSTFIGKISFKLGFQNFRDSPANKHMEDLNNCVGLAMFWKRDVELEFYDSSENYLDFVVNVSDVKRYRLLGFYGHPKNKELSWKWLKQLSNKSPKDPWVTGGDFNEILYPKEKDGRCDKAPAKMKAFKNALEICNLDDLSFDGSIFTWMGNGGVKERLDRVVATSTWKELFPCHRVLHLTDGLSSDHVPILLETDSEKQKEKISQSEVFLFIMNVEEAIVTLNRQNNQYVTTVSRMKSHVNKIPDFYYDAVKLVAPHLIQLEHIAVREEDKVTYERLVTLKIAHNIGILFLNSIVTPKPSREYNLADPVLQFPFCEKDEKIQLNLSEYLSRAWWLIKFIPMDGEEHREQIVDKIIDEQVENSKTWFEEITRDGEPTGSNIVERLQEKASVIGRAIIVYDTIISLLRKQRIQHEGAIAELELELLCDYDCKYYFGEEIKDDSREIIGKPLQFLLKTFQWRHSNNPLQYRITDIPEEQFAELTKHMLQAERDAVMIQNPWIKLIIDNGTEKEKLVKLVDRSTIKRQLEVLRNIGCISCSKNYEIALSKGDENGESIIRRLEKAASEALKTVSKNKKSMTYKAYMCKLREAYNGEKNKKREVVGNGKKQGEKKASF